MSEREWKPGDVAMVRNEHGVWNLAVCSVKPIGLVWQYGVADSQMPLNAEARPLVVIDPEDRGQVERLAGLLARNGKVDEPFTGAWPDKVQAALHSLVTPPKPPEPTGLGAVVVDVDGQLWVRTDYKHPWCATYDDDSGESRNYADVTAVRVLSEGVTP